MKRAFKEVKASFFGFFSINSDGFIIGQYLSQSPHSLQPTAINLSSLPQQLSKDDAVDGARWTRNKRFRGCAFWFNRTTRRTNMDKSSDLTDRLVDSPICV